MFTHVGCFETKTYQHRSSRLFGHTGPSWGKAHALVRVGGTWVALCGKSCLDWKRDQFEYKVPVEFLECTDAARVGCAKCRAKLAKVVVS
jgi:hypothetical protein